MEMSFKEHLELARKKQNEKKKGNKTNTKRRVIEKDGCFKRNSSIIFEY